MGKSVYSLLECVEDVGTKARILPPRECRFVGGPRRCDRESWRGVGESYEGEESTVLHQISCSILLLMSPSGLSGTFS